jgi:hypothetical protein
MTMLEGVWDIKVRRHAGFASLREMECLRKQLEKRDFAIAFDGRCGG